MYHPKQTSNKCKKAFTLVELIVVIVILAILATIAFLSFSNQSSSARDSTRLTDLSNIAKWLWVNQVIWWKYPIPDKKVWIYPTSATLIWFQWEAWSSTLNMIKFSAWWWKDPLDKVFYTYSTNITQNKYQLLTFLENSNYVTYDFNPFKESFYSIDASDYSNRYPFEKWDKLWMILSKTTSAAWNNSWTVVYTPIQDVPSIYSSTGFAVNDVAINTWMITVIKNDSIVSWVTADYLIGFTSPINPVPSNEVKSWDQIKSDTDLYNLTGSWVTYIFGTWSFYMQNWASETCDPSNINVISKNDFSSSYVVPANTIVKVPNWTYNLDWNTSAAWHISFAWNCSAIIWESANWVNFNSATVWGWYIIWQWVFTVNWWNNIISNFTVKWNKSNTTNNYGLWISFWASNSTLKNIVVYDSIRDWINVSSSNNSIINVNAYNNWTWIGYYWISIGGSSNYLNNAQAFNNFDWFKIQWQNNAINNIQVFNNGNHGFYMTNLQNSTLYNIHAAHNWNVWINVQSSASSNNILSSIQSFNNSYWLQSFWWTGSTYYWNAKIYSCWWDCSTSALPAWTDSLMGWANWTNSSTWATGCSNHSQPQWWFDWTTCNTDWSVAFTSLPITWYAFWSSLANQTRPVICPAWKSCPKWANLEYTWTSWNEYNASKKIWEW